MEINEKISVIIPVYNVEAFINECMASIIAQTYTNIEIILVNDGSTDNSGTICAKWAKQDERVIVYHKKNGGLMDAWLFGVKRATGKYIGFVDSDDWIDSNMYETLIMTAEKSQADIVACGLIKEFSNRKQEKEDIILESGEYGPLQIEKYIFPILICSRTVPERGFSPNRVTKLFRKELLMENIHIFDTKVSLGEDLLTTFATVIKAKKIVILSDFFPYHYRINNASMIQKYSEHKYECIRILHHAMEQVNLQNYFDFSKQLANDYISLIFQQMEQEILTSGNSNRTIAFDLQREYLSPEFKQALQKCDYNRLRKKYKFYLLLLKNHMEWAFIIVRKAKGCRR